MDQFVSEGGMNSAQRKVECASLLVRKVGCTGIVSGGMLRSEQQHEDYNNYRMQGHFGRFESGTPDRACSLVSTAVYEQLRAALPGAQILDGDLGENILVSGISPVEGADFKVGQKLAIGNSGCVVQITEANGPCYRCVAERPRMMVY